MRCPFAMFSRRSLGETRTYRRLCNQFIYRNLYRFEFFADPSYNLAYLCKAGCMILPDWKRAFVSSRRQLPLATQTTEGGWRRTRTFRFSRGLAWVQAPAQGADLKQADRFRAWASDLPPHSNPPSEVPFNWSGRPPHLQRKSLARLFLADPSDCLT